MEKENDRLVADELDGALIAHGLDRFALLYREVTGSTNADVIDYYREHREESIAVCEMQTAGRGRRGREWFSPFAQNIYCTIGIEKSIPASCLGLLSIVSGIALCQAIAAHGIPGVRLKWPNDLLHRGRKLGGILIESQPTQDDCYFLAIGFGINVRMRDDQLDEIPLAATSLDRVSPGGVNRQALLVDMITAVVGRIVGFSEFRAADLVREFESYDAFYRQPVLVIGADGEVGGMNAGINEKGQLLVDTDMGREIFSAAEISLRGLD